MVVDRQAFSGQNGAEVEIPESQKSWQRLLPRLAPALTPHLLLHLTLHNTALEPNLTITRLKYNNSVSWKNHGDGLVSHSNNAFLLGATVGACFNTCRSAAVPLEGGTGKTAYSGPAAYVFAES
jgi:hypothetical protein